MGSETGLIRKLSDAFDEAAGHHSATILSLYKRNVFYFLERYDASLDSLNLKEDFMGELFSQKMLYISVTTLCSIAIGYFGILIERFVLAFFLSILGFSISEKLFEVFQLPVDDTKFWCISIGVSLVFSVLFLAFYKFVIFLGLFTVSILIYCGIIKGNLPIESNWSYVSIVVIFGIFLTLYYFYSFILKFIYSAVFSMYGNLYTFVLIEWKMERQRNADAFLEKVYVLRSVKDLSETPDFILWIILSILGYILQLLMSHK